MTATTTPDDAMEDARPSRELGARVAELRASFESALRACAEPPTAQVGGRETRGGSPERDARAEEEKRRARRREGARRASDERRWRTDS